MKANEKSSFYRDLFRNVDLKKEGCPWLLRGIFINSEGWVLPCCKIRKAESVFGKIGKIKLQQIYLQRKNLNDNLLEGEVPEDCCGCSVAARVAGGS